MTAPQEAIVVEEFLPHPPDRVWRALTDPERLGRWFMPNDFALQIGHRFSLDTGRWGTTQCEVLEIQPGRLVRYSWRNDSLDTEVTWALEPEGEGTRLRLVHRGFRLDDPTDRFAYENMRHGWRSSVMRRLREDLAREARV